MVPPPLDRAASAVPTKAAGESLVSGPLNLLDRVTVESTRFPQQVYNGQVGTVTRRVIHSPGIDWEYDVHPFSNERGMTFTADELRRADAEERD
jgi:hypothetical protein